MKKYGKYETRPEGVPVKQPKVKSALLQTYLTSLLCMVLCVTMFFGTSYAWFTSEVNNAGNEIHVGMLKADLLHWNRTGNNGEGNWASLSHPDNIKINYTVFDKTLFWEPGKTVFETLKVVNQGDLAFNFQITMTSAADEESDKFAANMKDFGKYFEVWVQTITVGDGKTLEAVLRDNAWPDYDELSDDGWARIGTLDEVIANSQSLHTGKLDNVNDISHVTIALHMVDHVYDAKIMDKKLNIGIKLVAHQATSGATQFVSNAKEMKAAFTSGGTVVLATNVEIENEADRVTMTGGVLDGSGKAITYSGGRVNNSSMGVVTTSGGTVRNLTINGGADGRALYITNLTSDLFVSNCTFSGAYAFNLNSAQATDYTINFTNTTFRSWTSYANVVEGAFFTDCTFEGNLRPYASTTLTNCRFDGENAKLDVSKLVTGETIILTGCTLTDGRLITNENINEIIVAGNKNYGITIDEGQIKLTVSAGTASEN